MKFLYVGKEQRRIEHLKDVLNRAHIVIEHTGSPEHAFFKLLHEEIHTLFVDFEGADFNCEEVLSSLESLESFDRSFEIVLISAMDKLSAVNPTRLRSCYGVLSPGLNEVRDSLLLNQLTEKILLKRRLETLKNSAIIDGLTQLYNHAYFQSRLEEEIKLLRPQGDPITLGIFDIDNFKNYNDTNGHPAGDRVLKKVAAILSETVRKFDLTARYGGEEFVMVMPGSGLATGLKVAERFRRKLTSEHFEFGHMQPLGFVSASFGMATLDYKDINDKQSLVEIADQALYKAKNNGKNCIWYYRENKFQPFS